MLLDFAELFVGLIEGGGSVSPVLKGSLGTLRILAAQRFESRVEYLFDSLSVDIQDLLGQADNHKERLKSIEASLKSPRFAELLTEAVVQAGRATTENKLKRLAKVAVSGTIEYADDPIETALEYERHAVELTDLDISLLIVRGRSRFGQRLPNDVHGT